ncbi:MAG: sugar ABC transporter permease [Bacilli bacterium]|nr:sugar ABC transporter permease [Bacilli bacterium]
MRVRRKVSDSKKSDLGFQLLLLAWPVIQFCIFYIYVNINTVRLAFNFGETSGGPFVYLEYVSQNPEFLKGAGLSLLLYLVCTAISIPLALLFAYYIYKKFKGGKLFRFLLFLPSIISATVLIIIFTKFTAYDLLVFQHDVLGVEVPVSITSGEFKYVWVVVIGFYLFLNFGTTTLIYSNKMSEISTEVVEAARLDGVNRLQEFWHIVLPGVWPTLSTFIITGMATIFTNQYFLFTFYSSTAVTTLGNAPLGYIIYNSIQDAFLSPQSVERAPVMYHNMAALGILITAVTIPLVFGGRALLKRFGPSEK